MANKYTVVNTDSSFAFIDRKTIFCVLQLMNCKGNRVLSHTYVKTGTNLHVIFGTHGSVRNLFATTPSTVSVVSRKLEATYVNRLYIIQRIQTCRPHGQCLMYQLTLNSWWIVFLLYPIVWPSNNKTIW